jgi:phosphate/sulfate permease
MPPIIILASIVVIAIIGAIFAFFMRKKIKVLIKKKSVSSTPDSSKLEDDAVSEKSDTISKKHSEKETSEEEENIEDNWNRVSEPDSNDPDTVAKYYNSRLNLQDGYFYNYLFTPEGKILVRTDEYFLDKYVLYHIDGTSKFKLGTYKQIPDMKDLWKYSQNFLRLYDPKKDQKVGVIKTFGNRVLDQNTLKRIKNQRVLLVHIFPAKEAEKPKPGAEEWHRLPPKEWNFFKLPDEHVSTWTEISTKWEIRYAKKDNFIIVRVKLPESPWDQKEFEKNMRFLLHADVVRDFSNVGAVDEFLRFVNGLIAFPGKDTVNTGDLKCPKIVLKQERQQNLDYTNYVFYFYTPESQ